MLQLRKNREKNYYSEERAIRSRVPPAAAAGGTSAAAGECAMPCINTGGQYRFQVALSNNRPPSHPLLWLTLSVLRVCRDRQRQVEHTAAERTHVADRPTWVAGRPGPATGNVAQDRQSLHDSSSQS